MTELRRKVSAIFNFTFPAGSYLPTFKKLEVEGRMTSKHVHEIIGAILDELESLNETCKTTK